MILIEKFFLGALKAVFTNLKKTARSDFTNQMKNEDAIEIFPEEDSSFRLMLKRDGAEITQNEYMVCIIFLIMSVLF
jgi:hypothetical protein